MTCESAIEPPGGPNTVKPMVMTKQAHTRMEITRKAIEFCKWHTKRFAHEEMERRKSVGVE